MAIWEAGDAVEDVRSRIYGNDWEIEFANSKIAASPYLPSRGGTGGDGTGACRWPLDFGRWPPNAEGRLLNGGLAISVGVDVRD